MASMVPSAVKEMAVTVSWKGHEKMNGDSLEQVSSLVSVLLIFGTGIMRTLLPAASARKSCQLVSHAACPALFRPTSRSFFESVPVLASHCL